ncbi:MAG: cytidine/deoxycytidylate deaminase family protein [Clostridia bacterium]
MDKWDKRFMDMAEFVATWSSCARAGRNVGAIITKNKRILTTGYNGAPSGIFNCRDKGICMRDELNIKSGTQQEKCYAVHAEQNAIIQAAKLGVSVDGATLYCTHQPCAICTKMIINSGISRVVYKYPYPDEFAFQLMNEAKIELVKFTDDEI